MTTPVTQSSIRIHHARVNNLKGISLELPHGQMTVITGVSGSGKSSLAFDTLFAEGQRQYIESLSTYARQFLDQIPRPDVDHVDGLQPTLCIDQKSGATHPRSTVATVTEIYDYLRLLYARAGVPHCTECGTAIAQQSADQIFEAVQSHPTDTKLVLLAPMVRGRRGSHREVFDQIRANGWLRARVDGETYSIDEVPELSSRKLHTIEAVVDRLVIRSGNENRLVESTLTALRAGGGVMSVLVLESGQNDWQERLLSTLYACPECGKSFQELEPRTFSFNSPYGACSNCDGMGVIEGIRCSQCHGGRLCLDALAVTIAEQNIATTTAMTIRDSVKWFTPLANRLGKRAGLVAETVIVEILKRLEFLDSVGLHYLSLDRPAVTLSGGELQRVRLATSLGSGLVGVCYVLDEPSIGLHPIDNDRLIDSIKNLQQQGNTVVVVEHDEAMMRAADRIIDMGPGAGSEGGEIVSAGTFAAVAADPCSITGPYLSGAKVVPYPSSRRVPQEDRHLELIGVTTHNLKNITARFPLGLLIGVAGVSGSGKSSLVNDTLAPALRSILAKHSDALDEEETQSGFITEARYESMRGAQWVEKMIRIDQRPIGRGPRSCPATYCGVLDEIRKVFAATREAKQRGFQASRFSFNATTGRCDVCKGQGLQKIEMNFLSDLFVVCPRCNGKRYNRQTLMVRFKNHSIADILDMTIAQATGFFENFHKIHHQLQALCDIGLGYIRLGQASTSLSGGEAQRIKLGTELARPQRGHTVYLLDEPTTGLHFADVARMMDVLQKLVEADNTVIVIEHNLDVIKACDWVLEIGPVGGSDGGQIVAEGTPETIAACPASPTGRYLSRVLLSLSSR
jgi:excinuclease ABC subunit A